MEIRKSYICANTMLCKLDYNIINARKGTCMKDPHECNEHTRIEELLDDYFTTGVSTGNFDNPNKLEVKVK